MRIVTLLVLIITPLATSPAHAQADPTKQALARAQFLVRQLNAEKVQLAKQVAAVEAEKEALEKQVARLEKDLDKTERSKQLTRERMQDALDQWKSAFQELRDQNQDLAGQLKATLSEKRGVETTLADTDQKLGICVRSNDELAQLGFSILDEFKRQGIETSESWTGIKRVRIENLAQDYRFGIEDQQVNFSLPEQGAAAAVN